MLAPTFPRQSFVKFLDQAGKFFLCQSRYLNSNSSSNSALNQNGGSSVPLKHMVHICAGIPKKALGMNLIDKAERSLMYDNVFSRLILKGPGW